MNYLGNDLVFLQEERVNQGPDRKDRAVRRRSTKGSEKVCRPDRFVPESDDSSYGADGK